ncbi:MAG: STAS/SEC14 domain-containing protein [Chthoniobacterales bacterium]
MITILQESEGKVLIIEASDKLTAKDYEDIFIPKIDQLIQQFGKIRVLFYLNDSFDGWEFGAMWDDAKFGLKHKNDFERVAIVGGPRWVAWIAKLSSHFMHGELRNFDNLSLKEAISWIKQ